MTQYRQIILVHVYLRHTTRLQSQRCIPGELRDIDTYGVAKYRRIAEIPAGRDTRLGAARASRLVSPLPPHLVLCAGGSHLVG